jgi:hypothetical protein
MASRVIPSSNSSPFRPGRSLHTRRWTAAIASASAGQASRTESATGARSELSRGWVMGTDTSVTYL